ncbi:MAG TPA: DUF4118 domain-containing protein, partial [Longimicrobium sp.]|nr:DUF4118 domain-containing protein [Longimicrobium sp.]
MTTPRERVREAAGWAAWIAALGALTAAMVAVRASLDKAHVALAFLLLVLAASARGGRDRGVALAVISFLSFNFFFLPPYGTLAVHRTLDWLVLLSYLAVATVAAQLLHRARREADEARRRADEIDRLSTLGAETLNAGRAEEALHAIAEVIRATLAMDACEIWLATDEGGARAGARAASDGASSDGAGKTSAELVMDRGAGVAELRDGVVRVLPDGGGDFPVVDDARALSLPLRVRGRTVGVLRVARSGGIALAPAERRFFAALSYYAALGAERVRLTAEAERAEALREADRLKDALIASVSHDLRTPLTTIKALAHELRGDARAGVIEEEADRLNRFVADLLDLSRLNAGELRMEMEVAAAEDLVG